MKNQKGISLIALTITIIILLILTAITINLTLGERGIFNTAVISGEKYKISEYEERLEMARFLATQIEGEHPGKVNIDDILNNIKEAGIVQEEGITKINNDKIKIVTPERLYI